MELRSKLSLFPGNHLDLRPKFQHPLLLFRQLRPSTSLAPPKPTKHREWMTSLCVWPNLRATLWTPILWIVTNDPYPILFLVLMVEAIVILYSYSVPMYDKNSVLHRIIDFCSCHTQALLSWWTDDGLVSQVVQCLTQSPRLHCLYFV